MTNPSYSTPSDPSAYTSSHFPHQSNGLNQAQDYHAPASLPTTPNAAAPSFSAPYYLPSITTVGNKRQRPEEQEDDAGDGDTQMRGDASAIDKLKRACARCRGLKVCRPTDVRSKFSPNRSLIGSLPL
jgi:hypothetical protein